MQHKNSLNGFSRGRTQILRGVAVAVMLSMPFSALASSWSPTFLVNTESFDTIDSGDGLTDIELRFGTTGKELKWSVGESTFKLDAGLEIGGTASGQRIHAQDLLTSSGAAIFDANARFNSTITINGVTYTFPFGDGTATGKVLKTNGAGQLTWSTDNDAAHKAGQGLTLNGANFFSLSPSFSGTSLEILGTASGRIVHAGDNLTSSGDLMVKGNTRLMNDLVLGGGNINFLANTTIGDGGDAITIDSNGTLTINDGTVDFSSQAVGFTLNNAVNALNIDSNTISVDALNNRVGILTTAPDAALDVAGTISGQVLRAANSIVSDGTLTTATTVTFTSLSSCLNLKTNASGVLSCNNTDYLEPTELDTEAELETLLTDVSNVITNNDTTDALTEGATNLYFTNERVDDRAAALLQAGKGIALSYNDGANTLTISGSYGSGNIVALSPEYSGAVYYADGADNVGQLVLAYDSTNKENYYKWVSTKSTLQDYNIAVRVKVPENFSHWRATPIQLRYRTNAAASADNKITMTMLDTAGNAVSLTGAADLANTSWTTASITGPQGAGTYTPGSYITIILQAFGRSTNSGEAHAGFINLNWATAHP